MALSEERTTVGTVIAFGPFRLSVTERTLTKNGRPTPVGGRAFDILVALTARAGEVVSRRDLMDSVGMDLWLRRPIFGPISRPYERSWEDLLKEIATSSTFRGAVIVLLHR
jgi:hypothetical protein